MDKRNIIYDLETNNYSFEDNGEQVIVKLSRKYFLRLYIENDTVVRNEDRVKRFNLWTNGKSLKTAAKIDMIGFLMYILLFTLWCILDPNFFSASGKFFFIVISPFMLQALIEFLYCNKRLLKIKKLLNLND